MTVVQHKPVVIDPEKVAKRQVKQPKHFVFRVDFEADDEQRDTFLVLKSSTLNNFADSLVNKALKMSNLRVVFVLLDAMPDEFFAKVQELNAPQLLQKLFKFTEKEQINRILYAWYKNRADRTIASAFVDDDDLVVQSCDLKFYRVKFADFVGLAQLPKKQREQLKVDEVGNHVFWPGRNVSIDLDVIRYRVDDKFRKATNMDALVEYAEFLGRGIQAVMCNHGLTQVALKKSGGPDERHLRRIEQGQQKLTSSMIDRLAVAHGLSSKEYVEELIAACDEIVEQDADMMDD